MMNPVMGDMGMVILHITYHALGKFSRQQTDDIIFSRKWDLTLHANCHKETVCMKCQVLFSRKNKKKIKKRCLPKFLPSMQSVSHFSVKLKILLLQVRSAHKKVKVQKLRKKKKIIALDNWGIQESIFLFLQKKLQ